MFAPASGRLLVPLLGIAVLLAGVGLVFGHLVFDLGAAGAAAVFGFFAWFFRDPERRTGPDIVSPADGRVVRVGEVEGRWQVAVFMNVTDVHVNRFPVDGTVRSVSDAGAGFRPAYETAADSNVRRSYLLDTPVGAVEVVQVTGILARRLVSFVRPGDRRSKGDRLGMIVLGSRVDVFLPKARTELTLRLGQRVVAGVTPIAREIR